MTRWTFIRRSLRFHARVHLGVLLGATIAGAVLTGALLVGDSMRQTLLDRALARLGPIEFALSTQDRLFLDDLGSRMGTNGLGSLGNRSAALLLPGTVVTPDGSARLNQATIGGVDQTDWPILAGWSEKVPQSTNGLVFSTAVPESVRAQWTSGEVALINHTLAAQLNLRPGDEIIVRLRKPAALAQDAVISPRDESAVAMRLTVGFVLPPELLGDFGLFASQLPPANVFLPLRALQQKLAVANRANLMVEGLRVWKSGDAPQPDLLIQPLQDVLSQNWRLEDAQLAMSLVEPQLTDTGGEPVAPFVELSTSRIFLEPRVVRAASTANASVLTNHLWLKTSGVKDLALVRSLTNRAGVLTYLANLIQAGDRATPYSMVTAAGAPFVPPEMRDNEIIVSEWLARDLQVKPGDRMDLSYYVVDSSSRLLERTNTFTVRSIVPLKGIYADRTLMPEFPGLAKAESTHDWDAGFPLVHPIRAEDETYWKQFRGTPKAFVTLAAGQQMWANRFGNLTAIRYPLPPDVPPGEFRNAVDRNLLANLDPAELGLRFQPVRELALKAASQSQDFGQLFLGFSFFLILSALLLMALLFQFSLEQRSTEMGTLLALGFTPRQVRRLFLLEGAAIAFLGGILGALGGIGYAKAMLWALVTHWRNAVGTSVLQFHASPATLLIGIFSSTAVAVFTIWLALRKQARQPAAALLAGQRSCLPSPNLSRTEWGQAGRLSYGRWKGASAWLCRILPVLAAVALLAWAAMSGRSSPGAFFGAGSLLLLSGLVFVSTWLNAIARNTGTRQLTLGGLGLRGAGRRRSRSLATVALLASGTFVVVSIGVFRLDSNQDAFRRQSGTGGFTLVAESTLPLLQDLNTVSGREALGLNDKDLAGVQAVPFRVRQGDEASCLNLNRAQKPRLLGVRPDPLADRFTFTKVAPGLGIRNGWTLLKKSGSQNPEAGNGEAVPAIGDANSIQWALGKKIGDTLDYADEYGRTFKLRLVGAVANSILQGSLIIDESEFTKRFPSESGYRFFLIDAPTNAVGQASATLARALQDVGFELTPAARRLNAFNAVQNTYLGTFQILGGLGLLLGSAGLGVVLLRNVWERRGELALLVAVGFRRRALQRLLLSEHVALLGLGLGLGLVSALVAVLPALLTPGTELPLRSLILTLIAVLLNGALWTWLATRYALSGDLLRALRNE